MTPTLKFGSSPPQNATPFLSSTSAAPWSANPHPSRDYGSLHTRIFPISLCDGLGTLWVCLRLLGINASGVAAESDQNLQELVKHHFPQVAQFNDVLKLDSRRLFNLAKTYDTILLASGPPCVSFTGLATNPKGPEDPRAAPLARFFQIRDELQELCDENGVTLVWMLEEVASMSFSHRAYITTLAKSQPALMPAADFGWVHRNRLIWGPDWAEAHRLRIPALEVTPPGTLIPDCWVLRWLGAKMPYVWSPHDGATMPKVRAGIRNQPIPGTNWQPEFPAGRFLTFTTAFRHPADRGASLPKCCWDAFEADNRRYPLSQYVTGNLVTSVDGTSRPLSASEREDLHSLPADYTKPLRPSIGVSHEDTRCTAIGNGWHVPTITLMLFLLLQCVNAVTLPPQLVSRDTMPQGRWAEIHATGTFWDLSRPLPAGDLLSVDRVMNEAVAAFPAGFFPAASLARFESELRQINLAPFAIFPEYARAHGRPSACGGPDIEALCAKAGFHAAANTQHKAAGSRTTDAPLVPRDLKPDEHLDNALRLRHPYEDQSCGELDHLFALEGAARLGPDAGHWRNQVWHIFRQIAKKARPLDQHARQARPVQHMSGKAPWLLAVLISLMRWQDTTLPYDTVKGFKLFGDVPPSGILRVIDPANITEASGDSLRQHLLDTAEEYVDTLEDDLRIHPAADIILKETEAEINIGMLGPMVTREVLDAKFGRGHWRAIPRHIIHQNAKDRPIDDGKAGGQNEASKLVETIVTQTPEFVTVAGVAYCRQILSLNGRRLPAWVMLGQGLDDQWKGYRQDHVLPEDAQMCIISFVHPVSQSRVYCEAYGMLFGLAASVNQFNRTPYLVTAIQRRMFVMICGHYFDDSAAIELRCLAAQTKAISVRVVQTMGIRLSPAKRQPFSSTQHFLGASNDLSRIQSDHAVIFGPKLNGRQELAALINTHRHDQRLTSSDASSLRGKAQWLDSKLIGRPCRGAFSALIARQYYDTTDAITPVMSSSLEHICVVSKHLPCRHLPFEQSTTKPVIIYTDCATYGPTNLRVGVLLIHPTGTFVASVDVPQWFIDTFLLREKYINLGELIAGPIAVSFFPKLLANQDVIWFIDNTAALGALIKRASSVEDVNSLALVFGLSLTALNCRAWFEYVQSESNPSDVLSRTAWEDLEVQQRLASGEWVRVEAEVPWRKFYQVPMAEVLEFFAVTG